MHACLALAALGKRHRHLSGRKLLNRQVPEICVGLLDRACLADFLRHSGLGGGLGGRQVAVGRSRLCPSEPLSDDCSRLLDLLVLDLSVRDVRRAVRILRKVPLDALAVSDTCLQPCLRDVVLLDAKVLLFAHVLKDRLDALVKRDVLLNGLALLDYVGVKPGLAVSREALD